MQRHKMAEFYCTKWQNLTAHYSILLQRQMVPKRSKFQTLGTRRRTCRLAEHFGTWALGHGGGTWDVEEEPPSSGSTSAAAAIDWACMINTGGSAGRTARRRRRSGDRTCSARSPQTSSMGCCREGRPEDPQVNGDPHPHPKRRGERMIAQLVGESMSDPVSSVAR